MAELSKHDAHLFGRACMFKITIEKMEKSGTEKREISLNVKLKRKRGRKQEEEEEDKIIFGTGKRINNWKNVKSEARNQEEEDEITSTQ